MMLDSVQYLLIAHSQVQILHAFQSPRLVFIVKLGKRPTEALYNLRFDKTCRRRPLTIYVSLDAEEVSFGRAALDTRASNQAPIIFGIMS